MILSKLYSNDERFHNITFNQGLNVVLGKVSRRYDLLRDSHNLGKSTLIEVLDFMFLKELKKENLFKRHADVFRNHIFYFEIVLSGHKYLTIRRSVAQQTVISFKENDKATICNEQTAWDKTLSLSKARSYLNELLAFDVLPLSSYRKTLAFFLRTQKDYQNVVQLGKFMNGKHKDWKPEVFELLGYNADNLKEKYQLEQKITELENRKKDISSEMSINIEEYDKIKSALDLKIGERNEFQAQVDTFNFYAEERSINKGLVESIESNIAELNSREYTLSYDLEKSKQSIDNIPQFNLEQLKEIYEEANIFFPDNMAHSYEELLDFNVKVTTERNQYLRERVTDIETELKNIHKQLKDLNNQRDIALAALQDKDTFRKFKTYQKKLAKVEGDISRLELQLSSIDNLSKISEKADKLNEKLKQTIKRLMEQVKRQNSPITSSIKKNFNEVFKSIFNESALLYVQLNNNKNVDFHAEVAPDENSEATAEALGNSYKKMLCVAFDLAVLATYNKHSFFHFVYHDGVLEGLDNRKKELFMQVVRDYCDKYGIQYIFSTIEDDMPENLLISLDNKEKCLELNDKDDSGKLFGFSF